MTRSWEQVTSVLGDAMVRGYYGEFEHYLPNVNQRAVGGWVIFAVGDPS